MNSTALRAPSRLSLTALLFGLLLPFGALAEEAAPPAQAPVAATAASVLDFKNDNDIALHPCIL